MRSNLIAYQLNNVTIYIFFLSCNIPFIPFIYGCPLCCAIPLSFASFLFQTFYNYLSSYHSAVNCHPNNVDYSLLSSSFLAVPSALASHSHRCPSCTYVPAIWPVLLCLSFSCYLSFHPMPTNCLVFNLPKPFILFVPAHFLTNLHIC